MPISIVIKKAIRDALVTFCKEQAEAVMADIIKKNTNDKELSTSLRSSKFFTNSNRGSNQYKLKSKMEFGFKDNEKADALEDGGKAEPIIGTFTQNVREHIREFGKPQSRRRKIARAVNLIKKQSTKVKKHTRTYKNMKPVQLANGDWIIAKMTLPRKKTQPLAKGINKIMEDESLIARRLQQLIKL